MSSTIETMTFDHAGVSVANLAQSRRFYADVFGFTIVEDEFELPQFELKGLVLLNATGVRVELFERKGAQVVRPSHPADGALGIGWFQFALSVADVAATYARVIAAGAVSRMTPRLAPDNQTLVAFVADPDGNLIELVQRRLKK